MLTLYYFPKMLFTAIFSAILFGTQFTSCETHRVTKYKLPSTTNLGRDGLRCASKLTTFSNLAARFNVNSGHCEGEKWKSIEDNQTFVGYINLEKTIVMEVHNPPLLENGPKVYLLPIDPRNECEIEMVFTMVHPNWDLLTIFLVDSWDKTVNLGSALTVDVAAKLVFHKQQGTLQVRSHFNGTWTPHGNVVFGVTLNVQYKFTIKLLLTDIKVLIDDVEVKHFTPTTSPSDIKLMRIRPMQHILLHSITFKVT